MSTDTPTDRQPTDSPLEQEVCGYISVRLTTSHDEWPKVMSSILQGRSFIAYPHTGSRGTNPHYHLFIPSGQLDKDADCIRNRTKRAFGGGNKNFSVLKRSNNLQQACQYGSKEGTTPIVSGPDMQAIVDSSPEWVALPEHKQTMLPLLKKEKPESDWQLTYANMVTQAIKHARAKSLTGSLKETLQDMLETTKWRPSFQLVKNGVPDHYYKDYEFRSGKRQKMDMGWMDPKF